MSDVRWMWVLVDTVDADADRSEAFWSTVTRTEPAERQGERGEFVTLRPRRGDAWVALQRVIEGGGVHVDLAVDGPLTEASAEAVALGATEVSRDDGLVVLRSPGGLAFCLLPWSDVGSPVNQVREGEPDLLDQVCVDVPGTLHEAELDFWEQLTGWPRRAGSLPEFTSLTRPDGIPVRLLFQRLGEATGTVRAHIDFACHERGATRTTHVAAGAAVVSEHEFWTVMRDPVGRTYCLTHRTP